MPIIIIIAMAKIVYQKIYDVNYYLKLIDAFAEQIAILAKKFNWNCEATQNRIIRLTSNRIFLLMDYKSKSIKTNLKLIRNNHNIEKVLKDNTYLKKSLKKKLFDFLLIHRAYGLITLLMSLRNF